MLMEEGDAQFQLLVQGISDYALFMLDPEGRVLTWNSGAERFSGYQSGEIIGEHYRSLYPAEIQDQADRELKQAAKFGRCETTGPRQGKGDAWFIAHTVMTALRHPDGALSGFAVIACDISEWKEAQDQLRAARGELRALASRLQSAQEMERKRISREIHDQLGQAFTVVQIHLRRLARRIGAGEPVHPSQLDELAGMVQSKVRSIRKLAGDLRPQMLDELGLVASLQWQCRRFQEYTGLECSFHTDLEELDLPPETAINLYRVVQESLTNAGRHAQCRRVEVRIILESGILSIEITDDGQGFDPGQIERLESLGLIGMRERMFAIEGKLEIKSETGQGTLIKAIVRLGSAGRQDQCDDEPP